MTADRSDCAHPAFDDGGVCTCCKEFYSVDHDKNLMPTGVIDTVAMQAAGFTWDPTRGYPRWTHTKTGVTALRQPYMDDQQWDECKRRKMAEAASHM